jgi:hypothetical protein
LDAPRTSRGLNKPYIPRVPPDEAQFTAVCVRKVTPRQLQHSRKKSMRISVVGSKIKARAELKNRYNCNGIWQFRRFAGPPADFRIFQQVLI